MYWRCTQVPSTDAVTQVAGGASGPCRVGARKVRVGARVVWGQEWCGVKSGVGSSVVWGPLPSGCKLPKVVWGQESFLDGACVGVRARAALSCALICASRAMSALSCLKAAVMCQPITPCMVVLSQQLISMCAYTSTHTKRRTTHTHTQKHAQIHTQTEAYLNTETQKHEPIHAQITIYKYTYTYIYITYKYRYKYTGKYICMYMYIWIYKSICI